MQLRSYVHATSSGSEVYHYKLYDKPLLNVIYLYMVIETIHKMEGRRNITLILISSLHLVHFFNHTHHSRLNATLAGL